ncbi:hypothetical protein A5621_27360 [Mycobacterium colombiense]|uniref:DUF5642 domain-containing protein n=1 Tax=Mycobacterium colombiense TaxID=339268 RepID=A0A1A3EXY7_9MYCO|nr:DUF5642 family protein [Mycobacterium colombiense]OBH56347.1 hypothetical protein A5685_08105 [Mycobacterium colombiense]OBJ16065.1 hypothetical protein A5623_02150 [Mycobacterium colombiense]OBJ26768.1 hypothetical protein A5621_27360 [Mycobacterium colombiense]OBJ37148.1 hypothetical protein A5620_18960 [Mycobacterium colombiense]OBJ62260.1 hypothetical protein A5628_03625 [Mycobacterium colombiense]
MSKMLLAVAAVCVLAGCSSATHSAKVDISKVADVKSSFGPEFKVSDISERGIDPKLLAGRKLPDGLTFDPANCAKVAAGPDMPADLQGNMSAVTAEGRGNRFVVIALETSKALPFNDPGKDCNKVTFTGPQMRGGVQVVEVPQIESTRTLGVHRVMQALTPGGPRTGELYDYSAAFGDYQVIVIANPLVLPNQPVAPVDTQRARDLLVKAVSAVRT